MDGSSISSLRDSGNLNGFDAGLSCFTDTSLRLHPHNIVSGTRDEISLDLDLGFSGYSSRSTTNFAAPKTSLTSGSSLVDISLDFNLILGPKRPCDDKHASMSVKPSENERPNVDLELSLSFGCTESNLTSVGVETQTLSSIHQIVDEGSTSSKWKHGALVAQVDELQAAAVEPAKIDNPGTVSVQQRKTAIKTCQFPSCQKGARGASGRCISHGGGRRCQKPGCQKGAEGKTAFCKGHGGGRRCEHFGCTKSAEGRTNLCIAHGGGKRCTYPGGCSHAARGKSGLCIRHGGGNRCQAENCTKSAEGQLGLCIAHGGGPRCQYPECTKGAQGSTKFCKAHGGGKRCTFVGCTKGAEGSTLFCKGHGGGKRCTFQGGGVCPKSVHGGTLYCVSHGGGKRCSVPECTKSARGRTDCCVRHGGGKRCKFEGCGKSAQGRTDFCKAHGGGKQCLWGQTGSGFDEDGGAPCDKFARGKFGLCAAHGAQVQDERVHGDGTVGLKMKETSNETVEGSSSLQNGITFEDYGLNLPPMQFAIPKDLLFVDGPGESSNAATLPEGRVHGGSLMAMLRGG
ncbi:hypothetical protein RND81_14G107900 [Saponaria officinalis]|uniref:WRKY19-like zinc finger domain-containing protein n=1 Tax=Saponaria officinalis TaxID=3572 RepID=A0AAW1GR21_SAPOF